VVVVVAELGVELPLELVVEMELLLFLTQLLLN
jgi:hypothetical protein